jgi:hypothetical protein
MIILGLILLLVGWLLKFPHHHIVEIIGLIVLIVGVALFILGMIGRPVGGRRYWF